MTAIRPALIFGAVGAVSALGIFAVLGSPIGEGWGAEPAVAGVSAAAAGFLVWPRLFRQRRPTWLRGAMAGALVTVLAYPLMWYFILLGYWLSSLGTPGPSQVIPPWTAVPASLVYAAWGLVITGWISVPIGAATGGLLALLDDGRAPSDGTPQR